MGHAAKKGNELPITRGIQADASCLPSRNIAEGDGLTWWEFSSYALCERFKIAKVKPMKH